MMHFFINLFVCLHIDIIDIFGIIDMDIVAQIATFPVITLEFLS